MRVIVMLGLIMVVVLSAVFISNQTATDRMVQNAAMTNVQTATYQDTAATTTAVPAMTWANVQTTNETTMAICTVVTNCDATLAAIEQTGHMLAANLGRNLRAGEV